MHRATAWLRRFLVALALSAGLGAAEAPPLVTTDGERRSDLVTPGQGSLSTDAAIVDSTGADPTPATAREADGTLIVSIDGAGGSEGLSNAVRLLLLITILSVAPGFLIMATSFTRVIIVLGFVRRALGTQTLPPNQVLLGLSLFLTLFIMAPTGTRMHQEAIQPYFAEEITEAEAWARSEAAIREFLGRHTRKNDLALFLRISGAERPASLDEVPLTTLVPAFVTSELKTAFQMGFVLFLPFIVIDLVIAAILMSLGMMMLPPVTISLPFKILLFVLVDGWALLVQSLVASYA